MLSPESLPQLTAIQQTSPEPQGWHSGGSAPSESTGPRSKGVSTPSQEGFKLRPPESPPMCFDG